ncbi:MAG: preprotein translocase subunit SecG [Geminicoccaceae bacterium]|nr:MAG: preprotein translocase subunit SecG [Geminicoccaceae bacterium]
MQTVLLVIHLLLALALVGVILMQRSEGGALGGLGGMAGGGGGAGSFGGLFTARGGANFLTRTTAILAVCFLSTSMLLAILAGFDRDPGSVLDRVPLTPVEPAAPVAPAAPIAN